MKRRTYVEMLDALGMEIKQTWSEEARTAYYSLLRILRRLDKERETRKSTA
jgi:hypothetical protein